MPELRTTQEYLNDKLGTVGLTKQQCLIRLAALAAQDATEDVAANNYAGTTVRTAQEALNVKAGTVGLTKQDAARRI